MLTAWLFHGVHMVHLWMMEMKSRVEGMTSGHMYMACCIKIARSGLHFLLFFFLIFLFPFLEHLGLGLEVIGHNIDHRT